jgi:hypothetical protein
MRSDKRESVAWGLVLSDRLRLMVVAVTVAGAD